MASSDTQLTRPIPIFREGYAIESTSRSGWTVENLRAYSHPDGKKIELEWDLPPEADANEPVTYRVYRRLQSYAYGLEDAGELVYQGSNQKFVDTDLETQTYYYYLVVAADDDGNYAVENSSRVFQLSIDDTLKSKDFLWRIVPPDYRNEDVAQNDLLAKFLDIVGAGLNLARSRTLALRNLTDWENSPLHMVMFQGSSLGFQPETSYDFNVSRRALNAILDVRKKKGALPGIVEFIRVLVGWEADILEYGDESEGNNAGTRSLMTWGGPGHSVEQYAPLPSAVTLTPNSMQLNSAGWTVDEWKDGFMVDAMGNVLKIESNTEDTLTFREIDFGTGSGSGDTITVEGSALGWRSGMIVQIVNPAGTVSECVPVVTVTPTELTLAWDLTGTYATGSKLRRLHSMPMWEWKGEGEMVGASLVDLLNFGQWNENQWTSEGGYKAVDANGTVYSIEASSGNFFTPDNSMVEGNYAIASNFGLGNDYAGREPYPRFFLYKKTHSFLYRSVFRKALQGTSDDPFFYLYGGDNPFLMPSFGPNDLAIFIPNVALYYGVVSSVGTNTITDTQLSEWASVIPSDEPLWVNPNRNQTRMFPITSIVGDVITMQLPEGETDLSGYTTVGAQHFILREKDALKYARLVERLREEISSDAHVYVFFE